MDTEQMVRYGSVCGLLMMIGLVVAIGIVAHSVWVGLMCFVGLVLLFVAWNKGTDFEYGPFFLWTLVGLALVGGATWLSRFAGRWLWVPLWLLVGFLLASAGWYIRKKDEEWVGVLALIVGVLCGLFALAIRRPSHSAIPTRCVGLALQRVVAPTGHCGVLEPAAGLEARE